MSRPPAEEEEDPLSASDTAKDIMDDNTVPNQNMVTEVLMVIKSLTACYLFKLPRTTRMLEHCALCHTDENVLILPSQLTPRCNFTLRKSVNPLLLFFHNTFFSDFVIVAQM